MNNNELKAKVVSGLLLKYLERIGVQGIQFIVSVILARLLTPQDYGIVAIISVFIALSAVFIQSGFNSSLIQKKEINAVDISSAFFLSLATAVLIYTLLFFTAPLIIYNNINCIKKNIPSFNGFSATQENHIYFPIFNFRNSIFL
jgi:teichuronic acid exporter